MINGTNAATSKRNARLTPVVKCRAAVNQLVKEWLELYRLESCRALSSRVVRLKVV